LAVRRRRLVLGILGVVIGLALVVVGVNTTMWVGAVGFAVMVAAAAYAFTPVKEGDASAQAAARAKGRGPTPPKGSSTFMHKLDERWERRERGQ